MKILPLLFSGMIAFGAAPATSAKTPAVFRPVHRVKAKSKMAKKALPKLSRKEQAVELWRRGARAENAGRTTEAETLYKKCLSLDPKCSDGLYALSSLYAETGRYDAAKKYLSRLYEIQPDLARTMMRHVDNLETSKRLHENSQNLSERSRF